jgi:hypothetical protein
VIPTHYNGLKGVHGFCPSADRAYTAQVANLHIWTAVCALGDSEPIDKALGSE